MVGVNPVLSFQKEDSYINLFEDPFLEDYKDETGLYLIGDGFASAYARLGEDGSPVQGDFSYRIEFDIYACPHTLDEPVMKKDKNGILSRVGLEGLNLSWLRDLARIGGSDFFASFRKGREIKDEAQLALEDIINRRNLGNVILDKLRQRSGKKYRRILRNYKRERMGTIVPLMIPARA